MRKSKTSSLANQMKERDREMVPRILVQGMFALMAATLLLVTYARITDRPLEGALVASAVIEERAVTLKGDRSSGIAVIDDTGAVLARSDDPRKGFIDVVWNSVTRARKLADVDQMAPIRVARHENGRVSVNDDATGWTITLIGYGADNVEAFASLLE